MSQAQANATVERFQVRSRFADVEVDHATWSGFLTVGRLQGVQTVRALDVATWRAEGIARAQRLGCFDVIDPALVDSYRCAITVAHRRRLAQATTHASVACRRHRPGGRGGYGEPPRAHRHQSRAHARSAGDAERVRIPVALRRRACRIETRNARLHPPAKPDHHDR